MGGRGAMLGAGSAGGAAAQASNPFAFGGAGSPLDKVDETILQNERRRGSLLYNHAQATFVPGSEGEINLTDPHVDGYGGSRNHPTITQSITNGFVNTSSSGDNGRWVGINWSNVKRVSGNTYTFRHQLAEQGFKYDANTKTWVK